MTQEELKQHYDLLEKRIKDAVEIWERKDEERRRFWGADNL